MSILQTEELRLRAEVTCSVHTACTGHTWNLNPRQSDYTAQATHHHLYWMFRGFS